MIDALTALDGRYARLTSEFAEVFSEYGLIKYRIFVEVEWLKFILTDLKLDDFSKDECDQLDAITASVDVAAAQKVKEIEKQTNHDVKAVEYYIKNQIDAAGLSKIKEWVHFACTSDDINNTAYALMLNQGKKIITRLLNTLLEDLESKALKYKAVPMMSRTHGQPASPTTVGKEFVNFAWRILTEIRILEQTRVQAKINGATGNFNAHYFVYPEIDWIDASKRFIKDHLGLAPILFTTQVNPNHSIAFVLQSMIRCAATIIDMDRDMWGYISLGYFKQKVNAHETGSSTMPHKVNPIDFENSEGNMGMAISLMEHFSVKLQKSRFQRDLSDSTVLRSVGSAFGYVGIGIKNALKGLSKIDLNMSLLDKDLDENQALLAEPFQTAMRVYGEKNPYERLKDLTRGRKITKKDLADFADHLEKVPDQVKEKMMKLSPQSYVGLAEKLVDTYFAMRQQG